MGWKEFDEFMSKPCIAIHYSRTEDDTSDEVRELRYQNKKLKELLLHLKNKQEMLEGQRECKLLKY